MTRDGSNDFFQLFESMGWLMSVLLLHHCEIIYGVERSQAESINKQVARHEGSHAQ
jgi:hypothetical protein